ncbi:MAG: hypothetical protein ACRENB_05200 [Gemmatimonadales bacterium]
MDDAIAGALDPVLARLDRMLGSDYSAVLYGSRARGEEITGASDFNLLVVADHLEPSRLRELAPTFAALRVAGGAPPLLIEREEWARAADVFPIELTDMTLARRLLRGADPVAGVRVDPADLRRALETELRGKLLRLRQAFALAADDPSALGQVGARASASLLVLFRAMLVLTGGDAQGPPSAVLAEAGRIAGTTTGPLTRLHAGRRDAATKATAEEFTQVLAAVAAAIRVIDRFLPGGN